MKMLSIIIPVFNSEETIERTLRSLTRLSADARELVEVILIDDGSTDRSAEIIESIRSELLPLSVTVIRQENQGTSGARNAGMRMSNGEWLLFLDADDELACDPVPFLRDSAGYSVVGFTVEFYKDGRRAGFLRPVIVDAANHLDLFSSRNVCTNSSVIFRRTCVDYLFDPAVRFLEDWLFWIMNPRIFERMRIYGGQPCGIIHIHGANKTSDVQSNGRYRRMVAERILEDHFVSLTRKQKNNFKIQAAIGLIMEGKSFPFSTFLRFPCAASLFGKLLLHAIMRDKITKIDRYGR